MKTEISVAFFETLSVIVDHPQPPWNPTYQLKTYCP